MTKRSKVALAAALLVPVGVVVGCAAWAHGHYRAAQRALGRGEFAEAQQHFAQYLKVWFRSADGHLWAARAARRAGAYDEAARHLGSCHDLGGNPEAIRLEYLLIRAQGDDLAGVEGQLVSRLEQDHPDSVLILEVLTPAYLKTYQLVNAQTCLKRWLEREPDRLEAWLWRANVFQRLQNSGEALTSYRRIVELDPDNDEARLHMAGHMARGGPPEEALAQFEYVRRRQGDTPPVLKGMACCRRALNQPGEARRLLEAVLAEHPRDWGALTERGRLALEFESPAEAENWFRQAVAVAPYESDVQYSLYQCLLRLDKRREAEEVLARLKRTEADLARLVDLSREVARTPHDPALRCEVGRIMMRNGLETEGLRWLQSALGEDPRHAATNQALAEHYERIGNAERAAQHRWLALVGATPPAGEGSQAGR